MRRDWPLLPPSLVPLNRDRKRGVRRDINMCWKDFKSATHFIHDAHHHHMLVSTDKKSDDNDENRFKRQFAVGFVRISITDPSFPTCLFSVTNDKPFPGFARRSTD